MFRLVYLAFFLILVGCGSESPKPQNQNSSAPIPTETEEKVQTDAAKEKQEKQLAAQARVAAAIAELKTYGIEFSTGYDLSKPGRLGRDPERNAILSRPPEPTDPKKTIAALNEFIEARAERDSIASFVSEEEQKYLELARNLHTKWTKKYTPDYFTRQEESEKGFSEIEKPEKELDQVGVAFKTDNGSVKLSSIPALAEDGKTESDILATAEAYFQATGEYLKKYRDVLPLQKRVDLELRQALIFEFGAVATQNIVKGARELGWLELEGMGLRQTEQKGVWDLKLFKSSGKEPKEIAAALQSLSEFLGAAANLFDKSLLAYDYNRPQETNSDWNPGSRFDAPKEERFPQEHADLLNGSYAEDLKAEKLLVDELLSAFGPTATVESIQAALALRSENVLRKEISHFEKAMKEIGWQFIGQAGQTQIDTDFRRAYDLKTRFDKPVSLFDLRNSNLDLVRSIGCYRALQRVLKYSTAPESKDKNAEIEKKLSLIEEILRADFAKLQKDSDSPLYQLYLDDLFPQAASESPIEQKE